MSIALEFSTAISKLTKLGNDLQEDLRTAEAQVAELVQENQELESCIADLKAKLQSFEG